MAKATNDNRLPLTIKYTRSAATSINKHIRFFVDYLVSTDEDLKEALWYKDHMLPLFKSGFGTDASRDENKTRDMLYNSIMNLDITTTPMDWYNHLTYVVPHISSFLTISEKGNNAFTITMDRYKPQASEMVLHAKEKRTQELDKLRSETTPAAGTTPSEPSEISSQNVETLVDSHIKEYFNSDNFSTLLRSVLQKSTQATEHVQEQAVSDKRPISSPDTNFTSSAAISDWISTQSCTYKSHPYHYKGANYIMYLQNYKESNLPQKVLSNFHSVVGVYEYLRQHAAQHNIFITPSNEVTKWNSSLSSDPPTCPYTNDNTYRKDDVYAKAANALYAKMQKVLVFKDVPSLETTFTATASEADGYLALYRLLQFGHPLFQTQSDEVIKPTLKSRNILHFCDELKNWALYQEMIHNKQKEEFLFNYVVQQIRNRYGSAYDRGLRPLETAVNFWRCKIDHDHCSESIFPPQATVTDCSFALTLMQQYDTFESRELFETETESSRVTVNAVKQERSPRWRPKPPSRPRFRDGIICDLCGREGHKAIEDGCTDAAKFLRMLKQFSPSIYNRVERRDPDLTKVLDSKLTEFNNNLATRRKKRTKNTVKSTSMVNAICLAENETESGEYLDHELWTVAKSIFSLNDSDDDMSTASGYDSAKSTDN